MYLKTEMEVLRRLKSKKQSTKISSFVINVLVNSSCYHPPRATSGDSHILFAQSPGVLPTYLCLGVGFRRAQIFPEMNENLLNIFIFIYFYIVKYFLYSILQRSSFHPLPLVNVILIIQLEPCSWRKKVHFQHY